MGAGSLSNKIINGNTLQKRFTLCYTDWMDQQQRDLDELNHILSTTYDEADLRALIARMLDHFQDYLDRRSELALFDTPSLFCPEWCNFFENSVLWMGGCRPTMSIRLVLAICGKEMGESLPEYLKRARSENHGELDYNQLDKMFTLQMKTTIAENAIFAKMTSLQESISRDDPIMKMVSRANRLGVWREEEKKALDGYAETMRDLFHDADKLRMETVRDLLAILNPFQAVDLLITSKKLQLSLHEWGKVRNSILSTGYPITNNNNNNNHNK